MAADATPNYLAGSMSRASEGASEYLSERT